MNTTIVRNKDSLEKALAIGAGIIIVIAFILFWFIFNPQKKLEDLKKEKKDLEDIRNSSKEDQERNELKKKKLETNQKYIRYVTRALVILITLTINYLYVSQHYKTDITINDIVGYILNCNAAILLVTCFISYIITGKLLSFDYIVELYTNKVEIRIIKLLNKDTDNVEALLACNYSNIESVGPKIEELDEIIKELEKQDELEKQMDIEEES